MAYPDINEKVDAIFAKEKEEADKQKALVVENRIKDVLKLTCTRSNLYNFKSAYGAFESLSREQQKYVPNNLVTELKNLCAESEKLQKQFEKEEKIRKDKEKAAKVQTLIVSALAIHVTRHTLSELKNVCAEYEKLTSEQKKYVTADINTIYDMKKRAKSLKEAYELEEKRRRERDEEERRRRQRERQREVERRRRASSSSTSHSSFGGSHSGFGGHSGGHGAGGKF